MRAMQRWSWISLLVGVLACSKVVETPSEVPTQEIESSATPNPVVAQTESYDILMVTDGWAMSIEPVYLNVRECGGEPFPLTCHLAKASDYDLPFYTNEGGTLYLAPRQSTHFSGVYLSPDDSRWIVINDRLFIEWCNPDHNWLEVSYAEYQGPCPN